MHLGLDVPKDVAIDVGGETGRSTVYLYSKFTVFSYSNVDSH